MEFRMEHKQIDRWTCGLNKKVQEGTTREFKSSRGVRERVWEGGSTGERKYGREGVDTEGMPCSYTRNPYTESAHSVASSV